MKRITKFWMALFGINFAIGIATGIILEFEFGTNWSNYSWFVGDISAPARDRRNHGFFLKAPLLQSCFWLNKVSKNSTCCQPGWWHLGQIYQHYGFWLQWLDAISGRDEI